jgi:hypothetical protein
MSADAALDSGVEQLTGTAGLNAANLSPSALSGACQSYI